jgi:hypothetical protein
MEGKDVIILLILPQHNKAEPHHFYTATDPAPTGLKDAASNPTPFPWRIYVVQN